MPPMAACPKRGGECAQCDLWTGVNVRNPTLVSPFGGAKPSGPNLIPWRPGECPFLSWGFCPAREVSSLPAMDGNEQYLELMCVGPSIPHSHPVRQALTYLHFTDGDDEIGAIKDLTQGHGGRKPHN